MRTGVALAYTPPVTDAVAGPDKQYVVLDETFKQQLELEQVDNTSDLDKPISTAVAEALALKQNVGAGGGAAAVPYQHTQASPSTLWTIPHNLGHRPLVDLYTSGWLDLIAQVVHVDTNNTQVLFDTPQSGYALLL
jgi:hypothetical protein